MAPPHKIVFVLEAANGNQVTEKELRAISDVCKANGLKGYYKRVGLGFSFKEKLSDELTNWWEIIVGQ